MDFLYFLLLCFFALTVIGLINGLAALGEPA